MFEFVINANKNTFDFIFDYDGKCSDMENVYMFSFEREIQIVGGKFTLIDCVKLNNFINPENINNELLTCMFVINNNYSYVLMPNVNSSSILKILQNVTSIIEAQDDILSVDEYLIKSILE